MDSTPRPILHIEDEDNDIHLLQRALISAEVWHPVQAVKTAARAFAYLLGNAPFADRNYYPLPSLILLDSSLPCQDGLEVLKWRQLHPEIKRIPVLMLTGSDLAGELADAYEAGVNGYLVKPSNFDGWVELVKAVRTFWLVQNIVPPPLSAVENSLEKHAHGNGRVTQRPTQSLG